MKKFISVLLTLALIISMFSSMTIIADASDELTLDSSVTIEGNAESGFSKWINFVPEESGRYGFEISFDTELYWGFAEGILCDSSREMIEADVNWTPTQMCFVEADLVAGERYYLQILSENVGEFTISVNKLLKITKLEIEQYPEKLTYYDSNDPMDISGLVVKATFEDGTTESYSSLYWSEIGPGGNFITVMNDMHPSTGDWSEYSVICGGHKVDFSFTKLETPIESITVNSAPSRVYYWGDLTFGSMDTEGYYFTPYDYSGINFTVTFKNGTTKTYTDADFNEYNDIVDGEYIWFETNFDEVKIGEVPVYVKYMGFPFEYKVTVAESPIADIKVVKHPDLSTVEDNFQPDFTGMSLELIYKDGTKKLMAVDENNLEYGYREAYVNDPYLESSIFLDFWEGADRTYISYLGTGTYYEGISVTDLLQVESIELSNVSLDAANMGIKLNYTQGYSENLKINRVQIVESYEIIEENHAYTWCKLFTNKGVIDCDINAPLINGEPVSYDVWMFDIEIHVGSNLGDVDDDGNINAADALLVLKHAAKINTLNDDALLRANVINDDVVNASDALEILKYAAHLIDSFE